MQGKQSLKRVVVPVSGFLLIVSYCNTVLAAPVPTPTPIHVTKKPKHDYNWLMKNYDAINRKLWSGSQQEVRTLVSQLGNIWLKRDGAAGSDVFPVIARAMIYQPEITLLWFAKHPTAYRDWLVALKHFGGDRILIHMAYDSVRITSIRNHLLESMQFFISGSKQSDSKPGGSKRKKLVQMAYRIIYVFTKPARPGAQ